ncbi:MAG TPA: acyl-CoA dehydrogenase family protein [Streptosporangiaceae bacterium]|nr:acyl-CoA dehydrogenase family protein [Streptosporangiaceae bacterium]
MDFTPGEAELDVSRLAGDVLGAPERESRPGLAGPLPDLDATTWKELAQAGLLALALPAELGGDGLGVAEIGAVLTQAGRHAARVPLLATLALGVLPVTRCADAEVQRHLLAGVGTGETILTAAIREPSDPMPLAPATAAELAEDGGTVSGLKLGVPYAAAARWILVPASLPGAGPTVVAVQPGERGLEVQRTHTSSGLPEYTLRLDRVPVRHVLAAPDSVGDLYRLAVAGACSVADGAVTAALELTTAYVRDRKQFGRPLATFQAVAQQIADVYVTARILHLATMSACWRLAAGLDASNDVDVAGYWLAEHAPIAMRTCHHLHGGIGMDVTYPLPRYSALITDLVSQVGGASYRLDLLGAREGG